MYTDSVGQPGETYTYKYIAYDHAENISKAVKPVNCQFLADKIVKPTLRLDEVDDGILISWIDDIKEHTLMIYRSIDNGPFTRVINLDTSENQFIERINGEKSVIYRARYIDAKGRKGPFSTAEKISINSN